MKKMSAILLATAALTLAGCATSHKPCANCGNCPCPKCAKAATPGEAGGFGGTSPLAAAGTKVYPVSPAQVVPQVQKALGELGFTVTGQDNGQIQTDWRKYDGEFHVVRRWEEQTRFRVSVIPDITNPTSAARIEVAEETQRRSNSKANWGPSGPRTERAAELRKQLDAKLSGK